MRNWRPTIVGFMKEETRKVSSQLYTIICDVKYDCEKISNTLNILPMLDRNPDINLSLKDLYNHRASVIMDSKGKVSRMYSCEHERFFFLSSCRQTSLEARNS